MEVLTNWLTLDRPARYEIKVPGHLDETWSDWVEGMTITVERGVDGLPVTTLTGTVDQAALHGLLRRLYALGLPLLSVVCVGPANLDIVRIVWYLLRSPVRGDSRTLPLMGRRLRAVTRPYTSRIA